MWLEKLDEISRRAIILGQVYETCRKNSQSGYILFRTFDESIIKLQVFKQFCAVTLWLKESGWQPSWREEQWKAYIRFVFESLYPTIPQPGQLKNKFLLLQYLKSIPEVKETVTPYTKLQKIYGKVLLPELRDEKTKCYLGLKLCY